MKCNVGTACEVTSSSTSVTLSSRVWKTSWPQLLPTACSSSLSASCSGCPNPGSSSRVSFSSIRLPTWLEMRRDASLVELTLAFLSARLPQTLHCSNHHQSCQACDDMGLLQTCNPAPPLQTIDTGCHIYCLHSAADVHSFQHMMAHLSILRAAKQCAEWHVNLQL